MRDEILSSEDGSRTRVRRGGLGKLQQLKQRNRKIISISTFSGISSRRLATNNDIPRFLHLLTQSCLRQTIFYGVAE